MQRHLWQPLWKLKIERFTAGELPLSCSIGSVSSNILTTGARVLRNRVDDLAGAVAAPKAGKQRLQTTRFLRSESFNTYIPKF
ncbi:MAG: hypothetical protein MUE44_19765 [Oscillatoriaceae cyanobacterium Prado104]|jgi:hypothetical protein|nr:hypothetical protein [Oscillatoriaceae cyanobacterium Prado104]